MPLTVYQNRRYDADFLTVRAVIGSAELGQVTRFESRMEQHTPAGGIPDSGGGIPVPGVAQRMGSAHILAARPHDGNPSGLAGRPRLRTAGDRVRQRALLACDWTFPPDVG